MNLNTAAVMIQSILPAGKSGQGGTNHAHPSDEGDLSDPFRREENYLNKLYIEL